jgi:plasmid stabilization system protein ParE
VGVVWSAEGADDFLSTLAYLRTRNPAAAQSLARRVDEALRRLDEQPIDGPTITLTTGESVRSWPIPPLRAYYQRHGNDLLVVRLYDQRRRPIEQR